MRGGVALAAFHVLVFVQGRGKRLRVDDHDVDTHIGEGLIGKADLIEETARLYGYDRIPMTRMSDELPPAYANSMIVFENKVRDELASVGLYEIITYRMTAPEREARFFGTAAERCVRLANPISPDRSVLRTSYCTVCFFVVILQ